MVVLARGLGDAMFGRFSLANSMSQMFIISADLGVTLLAVRDMARDPLLMPRYIGGLSVLKLLLSAVTGAALIVVCHVLGYPPETSRVILTIYLYFIMTSLAGLLRAAFISREMISYDAALTVVERVAVAIPALAALYMGYGLDGVAVSCLAGGVVNLGLSLYLVTVKFQPPKLSIDWGFWRDSVTEAYPFALVGVVSMLFLYVDTVILEHYRGDREVGLYSAAFGLIHHLRLVPSVVLGAAFPLMARTYGDKDGSPKRAYVKLYKVFVALGVPVSVGGFMLAPGIVLLIYGTGFAGSIPAFKVLILAAFIFYLNGLFGYFLLSIDRHKVNLYIVVATTIINLALNFALIPTYGYMGAAAATLVSEVAVFVLSMFAIHRSGYGYMPWALFIKAFSASAAMAAILAALGSMHVLLLVSLGAATYLVGLVLVRYFDSEDRRLLMEVLGR
jgi:O-antigen/teichoic acid export membrane protein